MPYFIHDLVSLILESNDHWWPRDLASLSRVSLAWLEPARRLLYATPRIYHFQACSKLARTLSDNPSLAHLVKGVDLQPLLRGADQHFGEFRASLKSILALDGLQSITLGGYLAIKAERFLNIVGDPSSVTSLHIDGSQLSHLSASFSSPSLEWDESIAFKFPSLEKLRLTDIELEIMFPSIPYQLHLSDLALENVTITDGYLCHLLHETPSLSRLCIQSGSALDFDEQIKLVLASCAVQTLEYEVRREQPISFTIFDTNSANLLSMRSLRLAGIPADSHFLALISQQCRNLEELIIVGRTVRILPHDWVTFITTRLLSSLRTIGLSWGTNHPPFVAWCASTKQTIFQAAASQDIQIVASA